MQQALFVVSSLFLCNLNRKSKTEFTLFVFFDIITSKFLSDFNYRNDFKKFNWARKKDFYILLIIFFLGFILFLIEDKLNPSVLLNIDEQLWVYRSEAYIENILNYNFIGGLQTIHPGITVMTLSGASIYFYSLYADTINGPMLSYFFNIPIIIYISIFFFLLYFLFKKIKFNKSLSFLIVVLISSNPYYITSSTPVDKFSAMSILLSLLFLIIYTNKNYKDKKYLLFASFFTSFAVLSKLPSLIVVPFALFILLSY